MTSVSRETRADLETYVTELRRWQARINLVSKQTLDDAWERHVEDGLQLFDLAPPNARRWIDLGTGGGSPGLVVAIALKDRPGAQVHLVESNAKKCAFLRHVAGLTKAPVTVHDRRIERFFEADPRADVVSARALAPLTQLLAWSAETLSTGAIGLFPKGERVEAEIAEARLAHDFNATLEPSRTSAEARIVRITAYRGPRDAPRP